MLLIGLGSKFLFRNSAIEFIFGCDQLTANTDSAIFSNVRFSYKSGH